MSPMVKPPQWVEARVLPKKVEARLIKQREVTVKMHERVYAEPGQYEVRWTDKSGKEWTWLVDGPVFEAFYKVQGTQQNDRSKRERK